MAKLHTNRQITLASLLLALVAAFAIDPPEHRCRTQSTRNRPARTVRLDDHDGDHNRWHTHGFDNSGENSQGAGPAILQTVSPAPQPEFSAEGLIPSCEIEQPREISIARPRGRAPPRFS